MSEETTWIDESGPFPVVDWDAVQLVIEATTDSPKEATAEWERITMAWMQAFCRTMGRGASIMKSRHFLLASRLSGGEQKSVLKFLEDMHAHLTKALGPATIAPYPGLLPVVAFPSDRNYNRYLTGDDCEEEDEEAASGGAFMNRGYGHIIIPPAALLEHAWQPTLAHELSHALLNHLKLPLWLDEGIATTVDHALAGVEGWHGTGNREDMLADPSVAPHLFWKENEIGHFWHGSGFRIPALQKASYALARLMFRAVKESARRDITRLSAFIREAKRDDCGAAAAQHRLGESLGLIASRLLGPGDWEPRAFY